MRRLYRTVPVALVGLLTGSVTTLTSPAAHLHESAVNPNRVSIAAVVAATGPDFEMPFVCGQRWTGSSQAGHAPSYYAIDWNTNNDFGRPVLASAPGVVVTSGTLGSYGRFVIIDHGHGFSTLYGHLTQIVATVGTYVDQGDLVGYVGSSGISAGPHLHFEERLNATYFPPYFHRAMFVMNSTTTSMNCTDRPVTGDWNGDHRTDVGIYRAAATGGQFYKRAGTSTSVVLDGKPGDIGVTGDWNGDGLWDVGVRPLGTPGFTTRAPGGTTFATISHGLASDIPITGDWDGSSTTDPGVFRAPSRLFLLRRPDGSSQALTFGASGDRPITGDWNGDGKTDIGVFTPGTGYWKLRVPSGSSYALHWIGYGRSTDIPISGDWNGDRKWDIGVWRPSTAQFILRVPTGRNGDYANTVIVMGNHR